MKKVNGPIYRPMLWRAFSTAWHHKELWPFAVLAGLAGSGVVVNDLLQQAQFAFTPGTDAFGLINGDLGTFFQRYAALIIHSGTTNILYAILGIVLILGSGTFLIVLCQQMLIVALHRALHKKNHLSGRELVRSLRHHHFLRILGVDLLFHVVILIVLSGGGLLLRSLPINLPSGGAVAVLLAATVLFVAFVLNVISMLTLIAVGEEHVSILRGMREGATRFLRHPLVSCEVAMLVFAANLGLTIAYFFGLTAIGIPIGLLFAEAFTSGTLAEMIGIASVGALLAGMFTVLAAGFMTTFTYGVWMNLAEYLERAPFGSRFHHHIRRHFAHK
jgi:hypothetical protein